MVLCCSNGRRCGFGGVFAGDRRRGLSGSVCLRFADADGVLQVDAVDNQRQTALHIAILYDATAAATVLVNAGANSKAVDAYSVRMKLQLLLASVSLLFVGHSLLFVAAFCRGNDFCSLWDVADCWHSVCSVVSGVIW